MNPAALITAAILIGAILDSCDSRRRCSFYFSALSFLTLELAFWPRILADDR